MYMLAAIIKAVGKRMNASREQGKKKNLKIT
jgi:hypothetical protein